MSRMLKSSGAVGAATLISRVLGFLRESAFAAFMGDGPVADAFIFAMQVPNLFRRLLGEGALTAAFIPIFKDKEKNAGQASMWRAANAVICALLLLSAGLVLLAWMGLTGALALIPMGLDRELIVRLLRVMFPYVGLVCVAAVFIGILNARGRYFMPALGATMLNVAMIGSVFGLAPLFGTQLETQVFGLAWGLLLAGLAQAAFQVPGLWAEGFRPRWVTPWTDPTVREVARRMGPATLGVAAYQINILLTQVLAVTEGKQIVASFNYAVRLMELPQGVVGISLATFLLTELSGPAAEKKFPGFRTGLRGGMLRMVFINGLALVLLVVLAEPMVRLLFERGKFTPDATDRASFALLCLAPGLLSFSLSNIVARAFYALGDTKTPMQISLFCLAVNLVLVFLLVGPMRQGGLGVANTLSATLNASLLLYALKRKLPKFGLLDMLPGLGSVAGASVLAAITAWGVNAQWDRSFGHAHLLQRAGAVFVPIAAAGAVYMAVALWLKVPQAAALRDLVLGRLLRRGAKPPAAPPRTPAA